MGFYVLVDPKVDGDEETAATDFRILGETKTGEAPRCPVCGRYTALLPTLPPIRVELEKWGRSFGDIAFGPGKELLVSERIFNLYGTSGLRGLDEIAPADVVKVKSHKGPKSRPPEYRCCRVQDGRAAIDEQASGLERDKPATCKQCRLGGIIKRLRRIVLEPGTWAGEDFFIARGLPGTILVSERVEEFREKNAVVNCHLVKAEDYHFDFYPGED